jgi:hypothetical protein
MLESRPHSNVAAQRKISIEPIVWLVEKHFMLVFVAIVILAALMRLAVLRLFADIDPATANLWEYGGIAREYLEQGYLAHTRELPDGSEFVFPTAFMPPLPVWMWIGLFQIVGDTPTALATMLAINLVCAVALVALTGVIALKLTEDRMVALLAMAILAGYPTFVFSVATYHAVNLYLALFSAAIAFVFVVNQLRWPHAVVLGVLGGLAALARTEYVILFGALFAMAFLPKRQLRLFLLATAVSAAVVLPWTARNYIVFDRFIPVANSTGFNLFKGFNPVANGSGDWIDNTPYSGQIVGDDIAAVPLDRNYENASDDVYRKHAMAFIEAEPFRAFVELPIRKVLLFWVFDIYDPIAWNPLYQVAFWPVFIATIGGFVVMLRHGYARDRRFQTILAIFAAQTFVMIFYAVHLRYRMNMEPLLFIMASYFVLWLLIRRASLPRSLTEQPAP